MSGFVELNDWHDASSLLAVPARQGILRVDLHAGPPYLGRTVDLRRRLRRLLLHPQGVSRRLSLRDAARSVRYRHTGSRFESDLLLYRAAQEYRPERGRDFLKLRQPLFVKVLMGNRYPRACVTRRLTRSRATFYGPFPTRTSAERFLDACLDLFPVRRCTENLAPAPDHPGCVWGEMRLCLRPCQAVCDDKDYAAEVGRLTEFLATDGRSLLGETAQARDHASAALNFEEAARYHRVLTKAKDALRMRGELSRDLGSQCGLVLQLSAESSALELTPLHKGTLQRTVRVRWHGEPALGILGRAIRDHLANLVWAEGPPREKEDHLALLQRWYGSSFRKGEFVACERLDALPGRKLAAAAVRVAKGEDSEPAAPTLAEASWTGQS